MEKNDTYLQRYRPVELFAALIEERYRKDDPPPWGRPVAYRFLVEDEIDIWFAASVCDWDSKRETVTIPRWLARKRKLISELPSDNHHAWWIILKATKPVFNAIIPAERDEWNKAKASKLAELMRGIAERVPQHRIYRCPSTAPTPATPVPI